MYNLNLAELDYLTLTSFAPDFFVAARAWLQDLSTKPRDAKRLQYTGLQAHHRTGTAFLGTGTQRGKDHQMLQVSGALAHLAARDFRQYLVGGIARATRIDIQVTIQYPRESWSQAEVFRRIRKRRPHRSCSYAESRSGPQKSKLATVYYGSRTSDRVIRLYEKMGMADDVYLRFEVEYKGGYARQLGQDLAMGRARPENVLAHEFSRFPDDAVQLLFRDHVANPQKPRAISEAGNTKRWLLETVIPALDRFLNDHNGTAHHDDVLNQFEGLIDDHRRRR